MWPRAAATLALGSFALGACLVACFDLFHSTTDVLSACELDAGTPGCIADAGTTNLCASTPSEARANARHACAWLGACETPMGRNALGPCMFQALLAYDCDANPNHRAKGKVRAMWECLSLAKNCIDVDSCIFPGGPEVCLAATGRTICGSATAVPASNADVRLECNTDGGPHPTPRAENCALWGQTCAVNAGAAVCVGTGGPSCGTTKSCSGTPRTDLQWCTGSDKGIDCASNGAQSCVGFRDASSPWVACAAESDAGTCAPDPSATCANGVASSCPSGVVEKIDCARIFSSDAGCVGGALTPPFDWTSPCAVAASQCTESCVDGGMIGCARGAAFPVDCAEGLGACRPVGTDIGSATHVACAPPQ